MKCELFGDALVFGLFFKRLSFNLLSASWRDLRVRSPSSLWSCMPVCLFVGATLKLSQCHVARWCRMCRKRMGSPSHCSVHLRCLSREFDIFWWSTWSFFFVVCLLVCALVFLSPCPSCSIWASCYFGILRSRSYAAGCLWWWFILWLRGLLVVMETGLFLYSIFLLFVSARSVPKSTSVVMLLLKG